MLESKRPNDFASWVGIFTLAFGYLAIAHFVVGLLLTLYMAIAVPTVALHLLWFSLPYMAITGIFLGSVHCGHRRRFGRSVFTLLVGLLVSVAAWSYDIHNHRYQIHGTGQGRTYTIWWWYHEPYWHGYKPGNV